MLQAKGKTWLTKSSLANFTYFKKYSTQTAEENFLTLQTHLKNYYKLRSVYSLNNLLQLFFKFANFRDRYLKKKNYLEFNDISNLTHKLLNKEINRDFLYFRLDSIYNHLLIDEFQDTSLLQYKILSPIIEEICSGDQTEFKTFFYVGDIKQSIYRFRGGKRELFDFVAKKNSAVQTEVLNTNYRSSKEVVEFVNETFSDLPNYEYENQLSLKSGGFVCCQTAPKENLLDNIAQKIEELLSLGVSQDSIAILTHTNADVLNIYNHLEKTLPNIKVTTEMTSKLINQPNVKAVINAIKYLYFKEEIYKANCNAILGKELVCPIEFDEFILEKNITFIIKEIAQSFDILDENVLNFIEISNGFENIVDFIYEVDLLDTPIQSNQNSGVQIMTIFKSKGLEFDTVILLDKNSTNNSSEPLLFEYSDVELQNIYYKIKNLEFYDENYKQALQKELSLKRDDELNILYVALTRAKHNLIVLKNEEKSIFDVVNLSTFERGELLISKEQETEIKLEQNLSYTPLNLGKQKLKIKQSNDEQDYSLHSKYFGLATHYCLEILSSFSVESLPKALQIVKSKYHNYLNSSDFEDINSRVTALLENSYFQSIVSNAAFSKEQSLLYKNELKIVDLLLFKDDRYYIFDYKTTKNEESSHIAQVSYYKKAIQDITSCKEIESCIIYLHKDSVEFKRVE